MNFKRNIKVFLCILGFVALFFGIFEFFYSVGVFSSANGKEYDVLTKPTAINNIKGIAVDSHGRIYLGDASGIIQIFDDKGNFITGYAISTSGTCEFEMSNDIVNVLVNRSNTYWSFSVDELISKESLNSNTRGSIGNRIREGENRFKYAVEKNGIKYKLLFGAHKLQIQNAEEEIETIKFEIPYFPLSQGLSWLIAAFGMIDLTCLFYFSFLYPKKSK